MTDVSNRFPPLYLAACIFLAVGSAGLVMLFILHIPAYIQKGLTYTCLGFISFGIGEIVNHPKANRLSIDKELEVETNTQRRRNVCSLGNLLDIGALLLFFIGLSNLLFRG